MSLWRSRWRDDVSGMPTFLERYQAGDHLQVWADLEALGDAVRGDRFAGDAQAVAHETMKRVRHNAEIVVERLVSLGYQFESDSGGTGDMLERMQRGMEQTDRLVEFSRNNRSAPDPNFPEFHASVESLRRQNEAVAQQRNEAREKLKALQEQNRERGRASAKSQAIKPPSPSAADETAEIEEWAGGALPLSLKRWCGVGWYRWWARIQSCHLAPSAKRRCCSSILIFIETRRGKSPSCAQPGSTQRRSWRRDRKCRCPILWRSPAACTSRSPTDGEVDEGFGRRLILGRDGRLEWHFRPLRPV